ncbi:hypothetical protein [Marinomonas sp. THO17]|uniref:hypothetical protein n=1 Tax=Marinomonas sp. THO17 TaxID=3149048 RepID=UPI00336C27F2
MQVLLHWINQKILLLINQIKAKNEKRKRAAELKEIEMQTRELPDYLRKDLGLPPYDNCHKRDRFKHH